MQLQFNKSKIEGKIKLGGSKSISNRLLIIQKLYFPKLTLSNLSDSEDSLYLKKALENISVNPKGIIDAGSAGTNLRFLCALLSITPRNWQISGSPELMQRPIVQLIDALNSIGAEIRFSEQEKTIHILGKKLKGGSVKIPANISSQFISALLLIAPSLSSSLKIEMQLETVSRPYIHMTIELLKLFGANISQHEHVIQCEPSTLSYSNQEFNIESDWSSASYWYSFVALSKEADMTLMGLHERSLQGDSVLQKLFIPLGVQSSFENGKLKLKKDKLEIDHLELNCTNFPDLAQTLTVSCFGLNISCHLTGLSTLKSKETDRLLALKSELEKLGAKVEITEDSIHLQKEKRKNTAYPSIQTYKDHRMAMSFAPLLSVFDKMEINDPEVVNKSYPDFWKDLRNIGVSIS